MAVSLTPALSQRESEIKERAARDFHGKAAPTVRACTEALRPGKNSQQISRKGAKSQRRGREVFIVRAPMPLHWRQSRRTRRRAGDSAPVRMPLSFRRAC
jgi:hypothetical protein